MTGSERSFITRSISPTQLMFLLAASGLFVFLLEPVQGGFLTSIAMILVAAVAVVLGGLPLGKAANELWESKWSGLVIGIMLLWTAERTLFTLGEFYQLAVYPRAQLWIPILYLGLACIYAASLGLEPVARLGLPVTVLMTLLLALLTYTGRRLLSAPWCMELQPLHPRGLLHAATLLPELGLYALCLPRVHNPKKEKVGLKILLGWAGVGLLLGSWCILLAVSALGETTPRPYDLFTISSLTGFSTQGRHDLWYLLVLTLSGFLRISFCLYGLTVCLGRFYKKGTLGVRVWIVGGVMFGAVYFGAKLVPSWSGIPFTLGWFGVMLLWSLGWMLVKRRKGRG